MKLQISKLPFPTILTLLLLFSTLIFPTLSTTDPTDLLILNQFKNGLLNPELLNWPENDDDPCGRNWAFIYCSNSRVTQIQVQNMGLKGTLPHNLNYLSMLSNLGLQKNFFTGPLPSFSGLTNLGYAYLDHNNFTSIPLDFFTGLHSLQVLALDYNNFNSSNGWAFPPDLKNSIQLTNLTCRKCNLAGPLPEFIGEMPSLTVLMLSNNRLTGSIPASFIGSLLEMLWLNNQEGDGLNGNIDFVTTMDSLESLWLHGNRFSGMIPQSIGNLILLRDLDLNGNELVGLIPKSLVDMSLSRLDLSNNHFMGPIPEFKATEVSFASNSFCTSCGVEVMALIDFLGGLNYPLKLLSTWSGDDPCQGLWFGLNCDFNSKVSVIYLPHFNLTGTLSPSIGKLESLVEIRLQGNNLYGHIPKNWTALKYLKSLDISGNNISSPLPNFGESVNVILNGNPFIDRTDSSPENVGPQLPTRGSSLAPTNKHLKSSGLAFIVTPVISVAFVAFLIIPISIHFLARRKNTVVHNPRSLVVHPRDPCDPESMIKTIVLDTTSYSSWIGGESENSLVISVQVLRNVTNNFSPENELGRGGFGVVYKGELEDGTKIAVKRMEAGVISIKALDEFQSEIKVLSKFRHRNLVSLLGYSVSGNERIIVYEYMPQGALSKHLFEWRSLKLEPLSWKRRLNIALDVARGMEYLHGLAQQSFIHRDLKSSNILLGNDFRAKVSDFGLVKLAPDGQHSVATRLAGTFGYLAPEYAVTGKITTKADVFSFGVVLMELLTGLTALDEDRSEETRYLAAWFWRMMSDKDKLMSAVYQSMGAKEDMLEESILIVAELAGHCTARESSQRPDMGHAVNVLAPLVEKWEPFDEDMEEYSGIDSLPLNQMVKGWQEIEAKGLNCVGLGDSRGSIPARPMGFAESFTSADGR